MVLPLIAGAVGLVLTFLTVDAVATVAHWFSVIGSLLVVAGLAYQLIEKDLLDFLYDDSDVLEILTAGLISSVAGFVFFRFIEALFAAVGLGLALVIALLIAASVIFSPVVLAEFAAGIASIISELFRGE